MREMNGGVHNYAQDDLILSFGLGDRTNIAQLTIRWPSGTVQQFTDVSVNQRMTIFESGSPDTPTPSPSPTVPTTPTDTPTPTPVPLQVIIDNADPQFSVVGSWSTNTNTQYPSYNGNFRHTASGTGDRSATFRPEITVSGDYEVFAWYLSNTTFATNTPYTINYNGGSATIRVNHRAARGGGYWHSLGIYNFAAGNAGSIVISNDADGTVPADAIRLVLMDSPPQATDTPTPTALISDTPTPTYTDTPTPTDTETPTETPTPTDTDTPTPTSLITDTPTPTPIDTPTPTSTSPSSQVEIIIDNLDTGFTVSGLWNTNTSTRYPSYNGGFRSANAGTGSRTAAFTPNITEPGDYEVFIWFFTTTGSATNAPHTINYNGGSTTVLVNRQGPTGGGYWFSLGVFNFAPGTSGSVVLTNNANGVVVADAVRFVKP
jgi:hypothetical protein